MLTPRNLVVCAIAALSVVGAVVSGCTSDSAATPKPDAGTTCPQTFAAANAAACTEEGARCSFEYYCEGNLYQVANCYCTAGKFQCFDQSSGTTPIDPMASPVCVQQKPGTQACPTSFAAGEGQTCTVSGFVCYYPGQLCNGAQQIDHCQCVAGGNGSSADSSTPLAFKCERDICNLEAGVDQPDTGTDASTDANDDGG